MIDGAPVDPSDADLRIAALVAFGLDRAACRRCAEGFSWLRSAEILPERRAPIDRPSGRAPGLPRDATLVGRRSRYQLKR